MTGSASGGPVYGRGDWGTDHRSDADRIIPRSVHRQVESIYEPVLLERLGDWTSLCIHCEEPGSRHGPDMQCPTPTIWKTDLPIWQPGL